MVATGKRVSAMIMVNDFAWMEERECWKYWAGRDARAHLWQDSCRRGPDQILVETAW